MTEFVAWVAGWPEWVGVTIGVVIGPLLFLALVKLHDWVYGRD
ncbi:hypothetical protein [Amycolatopsis japonica]|nr:hypothetical protein [Amycolatopsis japonica]